jgi:hypothetical protein
MTPPATVNNLSATPQENLSMGQQEMMAPDMDTDPMFEGNASPNLASSFIWAGGGPYNFTIAAAFASINGQQFSDDEIAKLRGQFGAHKVAKWEDEFSFAVLVIYDRDKENGTDFWNPQMSGWHLGRNVIDAGVDPNRSFHTGTFLDAASSHEVHSHLAMDIDSKYGGGAYGDFKTITDQAMSDLNVSLNRLDNVDKVDARYPATW